jgi:hypothetical protein
MEKNDQIEPVEIFAGTIWEAELLKSIMDDAEIESFLLNEFTGTIAPWYTAPGGAGSVKVIVSSVDFERARVIMEEFQDNMGANL